MNVLMTGTSSGIGNALKEKFLKSNHHVYGIDILDIQEELNFKNYVCDITNEEKLIKIKNIFKEDNIKFDLIINVAGIYKMASFIETSFEVQKKVIDVNLLGVMLVNKTFHSLLTEKGKIIIITSEVASFDPLPFNGLYSVSKIALDAYSQGLRQELNLLGQKVITIRPGAIKTPLCNSSITETKKLVENTNLYKKEATHFEKLVTKFMGKPMDPSKLANKIYKISMKKRPKIIYKIHQNLGLVLLSILPKKIQLYIIKKILNS